MQLGLVDELEDRPERQVLDSRIEDLAQRPATSSAGPVAIWATARSVCAATRSPAAKPTASPSGNQEPASSV